MSTIAHERCELQMGNKGLETGNDWDVYKDFPWFLGILMRITPCITMWTSHKIRIRRPNKANTAIYAAVVADRVKPR